MTQQPDSARRQRPRQSVVDESLEVPSPPVLVHESPVGAREAEPYLGPGFQEAAECLDDQVAPLVPVEPADEEDPLGIALLQPPSPVRWDRLRRTGMTSACSRGRP